MSDELETAWAAFRSETPTNNQPLMRKAFHAGWDARDTATIKAEGLREAADVMDEREKRKGGRLYATSTWLRYRADILEGLREPIADEEIGARVGWRNVLHRWLYGKGEK